MTEMIGEATSAVVPGRELRRQLVVVASLSLVVIAVVAALFILQGVDVQMQDIQRTHETRRLARDLVQDLTDAETGQRGFLLTQDAEYLDPYRAAVLSIDSTYQRLNELIVNRPEQKQRIASVSELIEQKRSEMAITINMAMEGKLSEAMSLLRSDAGRSLMDSIRETLRAFVADEDDSLFRRNVEIGGLRIWLVTMIAVALAGAAILTYALLARTQRAVTRLSASASELRSAKVELEQRVHDRTAELEEARTHAERERARVEALLQDTNHRIGNSLATVSSLLGLQVTRTRSEEVRKALEAAQDRVRSIASAHRRLRLGDDLETTRLDEFVEAATEDLQSTHLEGRRIDLKVDVDPLIVQARDATTIGIIVAELVINAIKHAFPDDRSGEIALSLTRDAADKAVLVVADDGCGYPAEVEDEHGLGAMIIMQLARQFGGEARYERSDGGGTRVIVTMPELDVSAAGRRA